MEGPTESTDILEHPDLAAYTPRPPRTAPSHSTLTEPLPSLLDRKVQQVLERTSRMKPPRSPARDFIPPVPPNFKFLRELQTSHKFLSEFRRQMVLGRRGGKEALLQSKTRHTWHMFFVASLVVVMSRKFKRVIGPRSKWEQEQEKQKAKDRQTAMLDTYSSNYNKQHSIEPKAFGLDYLRTLCRQSDRAIAADLTCSIRTSSARKRRVKMGHSAREEEEGSNTPTVTNEVNRDTTAAGLADSNSSSSATLLNKEGEMLLPKPPASRDNSFRHRFQLPTRPTKPNVEKETDDSTKFVTKWKLGYERANRALKGLHALVQDDSDEEPKDPIFRLTESKNKNQQSQQAERGASVPETTSMESIKSVIAASAVMSQQHKSEKVLRDAALQFKRFGIMTAKSRPTRRKRENEERDNTLFLSAINGTLDLQDLTHRVKQFQRPDPFTRHVTAFPPNKKSHKKQRTHLTLNGSANSAAGGTASVLGSLSPRSTTNPHNDSVASPTAAGGAGGHSLVLDSTAASFTSTSGGHQKRKSNNPKKPKLGVVDSVASAQVDLAAEFKSDILKYNQTMENTLRRVTKERETVFHIKHKSLINSDFMHLSLSENLQSMRSTVNTHLKKQDREARKAYNHEWFDEYKHEVLRMCKHNTDVETLLDILQSYFESDKLRATDFNQLVNSLSLRMLLSQDAQTVLASLAPVFDSNEEILQRLIQRRPQVTYRVHDSGGAIITSPTLLMDQKFTQLKKQLDRAAARTAKQNEQNAAVASPSHHSPHSHHRHHAHPTDHLSTNTLSHSPSFIHGNRGLHSPSHSHYNLRHTASNLSVMTTSNTSSFYNRHPSPRSDREKDGHYHHSKDKQQPQDNQKEKDKEQRDKESSPDEADGVVSTTLDGDRLYRGSTFHSVGGSTTISVPVALVPNHPHVSPSQSFHSSLGNSTTTPGTSNKAPFVVASASNEVLSLPMTPSPLSPSPSHLHNKLNSSFASAITVN